MPHIILEYSTNIKDIDFKTLFVGIHEILSNYADIARCKSRAIPLDKYYIGVNKPENAMVNIQIKLLPGRTDSTKKEIANKITDLLNIKLIPQLEKQQLTCSTTLEILDLQKHYYIL